jgi:hypothetical protein
MTTPQQPGWYEDPNDANAERYWDGQDWTPHRRRKPVAQRVQAPVKPASPPPSAPPSADVASPTATQAAQVPPPPPPTQAAQVPPPPPPANVPPPSPVQAPPPAAPRVTSRAIKVWSALAGLALVLAIAVLVAGRVKLGSFLPGIALVAAIAIIGATVTLRSHKSVLRKAVIVSVTLLVVAAAIPASLKVAYPGYDHFFGKKSPQASRPGSAAPSSAEAKAPPSSAEAQAPPTSREVQAPLAPSPGGSPAIPSSVTSGILTQIFDTGKLTYGFIDPKSGAYSKIGSFSCESSCDRGGDWSSADKTSPDLTKLAFSKDVQGHKEVGWIDTSGHFTDVTPTADAGAFGGKPPSYTVVGFDRAGNFYYTKGQQGAHPDLYKLPAGSTSNAQKMENGEFGTPIVNYDGTLDFVSGECHHVSWLGGPTKIVEAKGNQIVKGDAVKSQTGCYSLRNPVPLLPATYAAAVSDPVANRDGTQVAFKSSDGQTAALCVVTADGASQPTKVNVPTHISENLASLTDLLQWK